MPIKTYGIAKDVNGKLVRDEDGNLKRDYTQIGRLELFKWEEMLFGEVKTRTNHRCMSCNKDIKKGNYVYGGKVCWSRRICITCFEKFMNNFIQSLEEYKKKAKASIKNHKKNYGMLIKNNVINSV